MAKKARVWDGTAWQEIAASQVDLLNSAVYKMNSGTTSERPAGAAGLFRFNSTTGYPEWYDSITSTWYNFYQLKPIQYLVVGGGGGGGGDHGGGGGAGQLITSSAVFTLTTLYTVTIGAGGNAGGPRNGVYAGTGSSSVFNTITATGGGGGGQFQDRPGYNGASGGGGASFGVGAAGGLATTVGVTGYNGAAGNNSGAGGGGGAGSIGEQSEGGNGVSSSITGSAVGYAGGGGGGDRSDATGRDGGGNGNAFTGGVTAGAANRGGGGGGNTSLQTGGAGGSGVVILSYPSIHTITIGAGLTGTTSTVGVNKVTTFTAGTGTVSFA